MKVSAPLRVPGGTTPPARPERVPQNRNKLLLFGLLAVFAFALPYILNIFLNGRDFVDWVSTFNSIFIFVLLALGLNIVVGYAGLLDLGYAAFFAIGAYTMAFLTSSQSPLASPSGPFTNFWVALPISFLMAALFGVLLGAPTLGLRGDYLAIVTLGFGEIVPITFNNLTQVTGGDRGLANLSPPVFPGVTFSATNLVPWYTLSLVMVIFSIWMIRRLVNSRLGRAWQAMREDEIAASSMGINLVRTKLFAFSMGASFAGFAGALYAGSINSANPSQFRFDVSIIVLAMVILGGMGNLWGVIVGAVVLQISDRLLIPNLLGFINDQATGLKSSNGQDTFLSSFLGNVGSSQTRLLIFGVILVVMMLVRPEGLFPSRQRRAELHAAETDDLEPRAAVSDDPLSAADQLHSINYNPSDNNESGRPRRDQ